MSETVEHKFEAVISAGGSWDACKICRQPRSKHRSAPAVESFDMMAALKDALAKRGGLAPVPTPLEAIRAEEDRLSRWPAPTPDKPAAEGEAANCARHASGDPNCNSGGDCCACVIADATCEYHAHFGCERAVEAAREQGRQAGAEEMRQVCADYVIEFAQPLSDRTFPTMASLSEKLRALPVPERP